MATYNLYHGTHETITEFDPRYSGDNTNNNDHDCFYFSDNKEVADDYGRQAFVRKYECRDVEDLTTYSDFDVEMAKAIVYDVDEVAEEAIKTVRASVTFHNPFIMDLGGGQLDCIRTQEIVGHLKGTSFDEETHEKCAGMIDCECTEEDREEYGCECDLPQFDGLIIKNCIDDIGWQSQQIQNEYVAFYSHQIHIISQQ